MPGGCNPSTRRLSKGVTITKKDFDEKDMEAIERMKLLDIYDETIEQYANQGYISRSEPPFGALFWVSDEELAEIRAWELEHNARVYHVIRTFTSLGTMDSYLYVSNNKNEWEMDRQLLKTGEPVVYVVNRDDPFGSEFGAIGVRTTLAKGLIRTW